MPAAQRVISLCPSLTETVYALDRGETLVGRSKFCIHPAKAVAGVERVGGTKNPHITRIVELAPDLVLMNQEENRREDAEALAAAGVPVLSTFPQDPAGAAEMVRTLGEALDARAAAARLAAEIDEAVARAADAAAGRRPPVRFAYLVWRRPYMLAGRGTYIDALFAAAGGENLAAAEAGRYPEIPPRALGDADCVLLSSEPFPFADKHLEELVALSGVAGARMRLVDGERCSWHGARTVAGLAYASELMAWAAARRG